MANNNNLFNAAYTGALTGLSSRWSQNYNAAAVQACEDFATAVDALIEAETTDSEAALMQAMSESLWSSRWPVGDQTAALTVATLWAAAKGNLLPISGPITETPDLQQVLEAGSTADGIGWFQIGAAQMWLMPSTEFNVISDTVGFEVASDFSLQLNTSRFNVSGEELEFYLDGESGNLEFVGGDINFAMTDDAAFRVGTETGLASLYVDQNKGQLFGYSGLLSFSDIPSSGATTLLIHNSGAMWVGASGGDGSQSLWLVAGLTGNMTLTFRGRTYTMPIDAPAVGDALRVSAIAGTNITCHWAP